MPGNENSAQVGNMQASQEVAHPSRLLKFVLKNTLHELRQEDVRGDQVLVQGFTVHFTLRSQQLVKELNGLVRAWSHVDFKQVEIDFNWLSRRIKLLFKQV